MEQENSKKETALVEAAAPAKRLGVDVGGVIITQGGEDEDHLSCPFFSDDYLSTPAVEGAFEGLKRIVAELGAENVHIVSKRGKSTQKKTLEWMASNDFHNITGIPVQNVHFCLKRPQKTAICEELQISVFIDDRTDVLEFVSQCPHMKKLFLFTGGTTEGQNSTHKQEPMTVEKESDSSKGGDTNKNQRKGKQQQGKSSDRGRGRPPQKRGGIDQVNGRKQKTEQSANNRKNESRGRALENKKAGRGKRGVDFTAIDTWPALADAVIGFSLS